MSEHTSWVRRIPLLSIASAWDSSKKLSMILLIIFLNFLIFSPTTTGIYTGLLGLTVLYGSVFWMKQNSKKIHTDKVASRDVHKKEIQYTLTSFVLFFGIVYSTFLGFYEGFVTFDFEMSGVVIIWAIGFLYLHDIYFYIIHRVLHHPYMMQKVHRIHHLSHPSNLWSSYSFHPIEALLYAGITSLIWIIEVPWYALLFAIAYNDFFTLLGHAGYERYSEHDHSRLSSLSHATTTYHDDHHRLVFGNYALYFPYLDRIFGTCLTPAIETQVYDEKTYYTSSVIQNIWNHLNKDDHRVVVQSTNGTSHTNKHYRESLLHRAGEHQQYCSTSQHNTIAIFIRDTICFSQIVIASLMNNNRVVLLDPSM